MPGLYPSFLWNFLWKKIKKIDIIKNSNKKKKNLGIIKVYEKPLQF